MWIEQWLDLVWYEVTLEEMYFNSLSELRSLIYGANVKGETVPDCGASEGEGPFSESLSVCSWHTKREAVRRWAKLTRGCVFMQYFWQTPGTTFRKGATTQRWDLVLNPRKETLCLLSELCFLSVRKVNTVYFRWLVVLPWVHCRPQWALVHSLRLYTISAGSLTRKVSRPTVYSLRLLFVLRVQPRQ